MTFTRFAVITTALLAVPVVIGATLPPYTPRNDYMIVGSRGQTLGQSTDVGGSSITRVESRYRYTIGCAASDIRVVYGNFEIGAGTGEANGPNTIGVKAAVETIASTGTLNPTAQSYPILFGGTQTKSIDPGASLVVSDNLGLDFAAGDQPYIRTSVNINAGQYVPVGYSAAQGGSAEVAYQNSNATDQAYGTGALTAGTNGTTISYAYGPLTLIGKPTGPCAAVVVLGDSIADGQGDASAGDGNGNRGYIARGLAAAQQAGLPVAYQKETRPSDTPAQNARWLGYRKRAPWLYGNVLICEQGINQLIPTSQTVQLAYLRDIWLSAKRHHMQVWQTLITPQTTSTDNWASAANQTINTTFAANRTYINNYIQTTAVQNNEIDGWINPNPYLEDNANPGKWITNGTAFLATGDGTHPSTPYHALTAPSVTVVAPRFKRDQQ